MFKSNTSSYSCNIWCSNLLTVTGGNIKCSARICVYRSLQSIVIVVLSPCFKSDTLKAREVLKQPDILMKNKWENGTTVSWLRSRIFVSPGTPSPFFRWCHSRQIPFRPACFLFNVVTTKLLIFKIRHYIGFRKSCVKRIHRFTALCWFTPF